MATFTKHAMLVSSVLGGLVEDTMWCRCNLELTMTHAAKLARHHRKGQLAERVEELRDWRFQEHLDASTDLIPDFGLVCAS